MKRPGNGYVTSRGSIYYWSSIEDGTRLRELAEGISRRLRSFLAAVTQIDKRIMLVRTNSSLGFISLVSVNDST